MKKLLLIATYLLSTVLLHAQVGIGTNTPDNSAQLELSTTSKGFLPPRLTTIQRDAITSPATGLIIFNTTLGCIEYFNNGAWYSVVGICNAPAVPIAATPVISNNQIVWNWTAVSGASYKYNTVNNYATAINNNMLTSYTQAGVICGGPLQTLYVWAYNVCGNSSPVTLTATPAAIPAVTGTTGGTGATCGTSTVLLSATGSAGVLNWYAASTGGPVLFTGASFTTPPVSNNTTYYVEASNNGCTSARTAVLATINAIPSVSSTTPGSRCGTGTVVLGATASAGTLNWYAASSGGSSLGTGTSFTTPSISSSTSFFVAATNNGCTSARTAVLATVGTAPSVTGTTAPAIVCGPATVTLQATASAGTLNWYANASGGASLASGTSFTTASISTSTTYYVEATNNGCSSSPRTAVTALINTSPAVAPITGENNVKIGYTNELASATAGGQWSSSNNSIATVNATQPGMASVTGVSAGTVEIYYTVPGSPCNTVVSFTQTVEQPFTLGQAYLGGTIVFIETNGKHGLIVNNNVSLPAAVWGCPTGYLSNTSSAYGSGKTNTASIVAACGTNTAAWYCYTIDAQHNWFLPSFAEFGIIATYQGISTITWSSTEGDATRAFAGMGVQGNSASLDVFQKSSTRSVLAARYF